jgi:hypothetical protein
MQIELLEQFELELPDEVSELPDVPEPDVPEPDVPEPEPPLLVLSVVLLHPVPSTVSARVAMARADRRSVVMGTPSKNGARH